MAFYQYLCEGCKKTKIEVTRAQIKCDDCKKTMIRDYRGERAGPPPPFRAYYESNLVDRDVYVKNKEQEKALCEEVGAVRTR